MNISLKVLGAPLLGSFFAWLASKGLALTPEQQASAIALGATLLTSAAHVWHEWTQTTNPTTNAPRTNPPKP